MRSATTSPYNFISPTISTTGSTWVNIPNMTGTTAPPAQYIPYPVAISLFEEHNKNPIEIPKDWKGVIAFPDGTEITVNRGNFSISDSKGSITYRANRYREFNKYINASDMLEEFVAFLGSQKLTQGEALGIPIELFIAWLVIRAAEEDGDDKPEMEARRLASGIVPRCRCCGRFIKRSRAKAGVLFCSGEHQEKYLGRITNV